MLPRVPAAEFDQLFVNGADRPEVSGVHAGTMLFDTVQCRLASMVHAPAAALVVPLLFLGAKLQPKQAYWAEQLD